MKLNVVADFDICGKRFAAAFAVDASLNLVGLPGLTSLAFPMSDHTFVHIAPKFLLMCESAKKADRVAEAWNAGYKEAGRLYDYSPVDPYEYQKYTEGAA